MAASLLKSPLTSSLLSLLDTLHTPSFLPFSKPIRFSRNTQSHLRPNPPASAFKARRSKPRYLFNLLSPFVIGGKRILVKESFRLPHDTQHVTAQKSTQTPAYPLRTQSSLPPHISCHANSGPYSRRTLLVMMSRKERCAACLLPSWGVEGAKKAGVGEVICSVPMSWKCWR